MTVRLYGNRDSGHAWKVRQALVLLGIQHEYAPVDLTVPHEERRPDFVALSPFRDVPVLVVDGTVFAQSNAILLMLGRETGQMVGASRDLLERWLFWEATRIGFAAANLRWHLRFDPAPRAEVVAMLRERANEDLDTLEAHLEKSAFILGSVITLADISCSAYLNFAEEVDLSVANRPAVADWLRRISSTPGWEHPYVLMDEARAAVRPAVPCPASGQSSPFPLSIVRQRPTIRRHRHFGFDCG